MKETSKGNLLLLAAMLVFGFLGIAVKSLSSSPLMLLYAMQVVGTISVFLVLLKSRKFSCKGFVKLIIIMAFFDIVNDFSFFTAVKLTSVSNAVFIKFMAPVFILIFAPLIINEKREKKSLYAIPLGLAGLFLVLYQGSFVFDTNLVGMVFALVTAVSLALYLIFVKRITAGLNIYTMLFYRYLISSMALTPIVFFTGLPSLNTNILIELAVFGLLFAFIGTSIHMEGVKRIKVQMSGILGYIEPLSATVYGVFLLSELPTVFTLAGGALILLSAYLATR